VSLLNSKYFLVVALVALAVMILWRLSSRTPPVVSFTEEAMVLRSGRCTLAIPMQRIEIRHLTADALAIDRTVATFFNGYRLVDEKVTMPANYTFGKAYNGVVAALFHLTKVEAVAQNGKMVLYRGVTEEGTPLKVLVIFKGKADLELLYPINDTFEEVVLSCLIKGEKKSGPDIVNRVVTPQNETLPFADWNENLFTLDILVDKDM
jgi:hypothetical protein